MYTDQYIGSNASRRVHVCRFFRIRTLLAVHEQAQLQQPTAAAVAAAASAGGQYGYRDVSGELWVGFWRHCVARGVLRDVLLRVQP